MHPSAAHWSALQLGVGPGRKALTDSPLRGTILLLSRFFQRRFLAESRGNGVCASFVSMYKRLQFAAACVCAVASGAVPFEMPGAGTIQLNIDEGAGQVELASGTKRQEGI